MSWNCENLNFSILLYLQVLECPNYDLTIFRESFCAYVCIHILQIIVRSISRTNVRIKNKDHISLDAGIRSD